jgi:outer membrane protein
MNIRANWRAPRLILWLGIWLLPVAMAQEPALKIGIVDAAEVLDKSPQRKLVRQRLDQEFAARDQRWTEAQKELQELEDQLKREAEIMTEDERRKLDNKIRIQHRELKRDQDELIEDLNIRRNEELNKLQKQIVEAIDNLGKEEKFDLILNRTAAWYWGERVDLTDEVLDRLAKQTKGASP